MGTKYFAAPHCILGRCIMQCYPALSLALSVILSAKPSQANLCGIRKDSLDNRFEVTRRGTNNREHVSSGGLLLQRLVALAGQPGNICFLAGCGGTATVCGL